MKNEILKILIDHQTSCKIGSDGDYTTEMCVFSDDFGDVAAAIEQIISARGESDGWVRVEDVNEEGCYLCAFKTIHGDTMQCVVSLQYVPRHCGQNPEIDKRFYVFPSMGHEIKPIVLKPLPSPPKPDQQ